MSEAGPDPDSGAARTILRLDGVFLLTEEGGSKVAVQGLGLTFGPEAVDLLKPDGTAAVPMPWAQVTHLGAAERTTAPDGRPAVVLEIATASRTHRFVVPTDDPDGTANALGKLADEHVKAQRKRRLFRRK